MKVCPNCNSQNREGLLFCEDCGHDLTGKAATGILKTKHFEPSSTTSELVAKSTWGTAHFGQESSVVIQVQDTDQPITLKPTGRTILGRKDVTSNNYPDIDLTPFGALERGVSRVHAVIERSDETLTLIDMGSSNGTHLNGQRLAPKQPRILRDGDEIRFGKLVAHIYFK